MRKQRMQWGVVGTLVLVTLLLSCKQVASAPEQTQSDSSAISIARRLNTETRATDNTEAVFDAVNEKAKETQMPALITQLAVNSMHDGNATSSPWKWSKVGGFHVAHLSNENLEYLERLANKNEMTLLSHEDDKFSKSSEFEVSGMGLSLHGIAGHLNYACRVNVESNIKYKVSVTLSSGKFISVYDACRFLAWAFAANGIEFHTDKDKPNTVILRMAGE